MVFVRPRRGHPMTPLHESVAKLAAVASTLKASDKNFADGLVAYYHKHGKLSEKQALWVGKLIALAEAPVKPVFSAPLTPVAVAPLETVNVGSFSGVVDLFNKAKEHLKFPKITLVIAGSKVTLVLNGAKSKYPGSITL